jgi:hypothetical protein
VRALLRGTAPKAGCLPTLRPRPSVFLRGRDDVMVYSAFVTVTVTGTRCYSNNNMRIYDVRSKGRRSLRYLNITILSFGKHTESAFIFVNFRVCL